MQYYFEALFRSEQYALVDNACREYLFVSEFFMVRGPQALDLFNQIMGRTLSLLSVSWILIIHYVGSRTILMNVFKNIFFWQFSLELFTTYLLCLLFMLFPVPWNGLSIFKTYKKLFYNISVMHQVWDIYREWFLWLLNFGKFACTYKIAIVHSI